MDQEKVLTPGMADSGKFSESEIVQLSVSHVRIMAGETDECLLRRRSIEAEKEVSGCLEENRIKEPSWFNEDWDGERLVVTLAWDDAKEAERFRNLVKETEAVKFYVGKEGLAAERLNREWSSQHKALMEKMEGEWKDIGNRGSFQKVIIGEAVCERIVDDKPESAMMAGVMAMVSEKWANRLEGNDKFAYSVLVDKPKARVIFGFVFPDVDMCSEFAVDLDELSIPYAYGIDQTVIGDELYLQTAVGLMRRVK